jgi:hypothetical protein
MRDGRQVNGMRPTILSFMVITAALLLASGAALAATTTSYTDEVRGVEISAGQIVDETRVGATFAGEPVASCRDSCTLQ